MYVHPLPILKWGFTCGKEIHQDGISIPYDTCYDQINPTRPHYSVLRYFTFTKLWVRFNSLHFL